MPVRVAKPLIGWRRCGRQRSDIAISGAFGELGRRKKSGVFFSCKGTLDVMSRRWSGVAGAPSGDPAALTSGGCHFGFSLLCQFG
jgi:hypothetical protein